MNKCDSLGLIIESTFVGAEVNFSINEDESWAKYTGDVPEYKELIGTLENNCEVLLLQNIEAGNLLKLFYPNAGRADYIIASIFVPYGIKVTGKKLFEIINITNSQIIEHKIDLTPAKAKLKEIFEEEFESIDLYKSSKTNIPDKIAYRYYHGECQLYELLDNLNQPCYSSYKSIFFIDGNSGVQCKTGDNLTEEPLIGSTIINPPHDFNGFKPYICNEPFSKPMKVYIDTSLHVLWRRDGYKDIEKTTKISGNDVALNIPERNECKKLVPYSSIIVTDKKGDRIDQYTLMINKETILPNRNAEIVEDSISNVDVMVSANGYEQYCATKDLRESCEVKLEKIKKMYRFIIPTIHLTECKKIIFEIKTEENLKNSPIEGYKTKNGKIYPDHDNQLEYYQTFTKKNMMILLILVLLSLCVGGCAGWFVESYFSKSKIEKLEKEIFSLKANVSSKEKELVSKDKELVKLKESNKTIEREVEAPNSPAVTKREVSVIDYLDNNKKWNRNEMEKYPETKGLWDAMNERRFGDILDYENQLSGSNQFNKVVECVKKNKNKKGLGGKYITKPNDFDISVDRYISKLNDLSSVSKEGNVSNNNASEDNNPNERPGWLK